MAQDGKRQSSRWSTRALEAGLKVALAYRDELEWHQRLLIRRGTPATMLTETGVTAKDGERVWWVLTPDGDVYPEEIGLFDEVEAVKLGRPDGTFAAAADGRYVHAFTEDRKAGPPWPHRGAGGARGGRRSRDRTV